jgi:hypothetical protein
MAGGRAKEAVPAANRSDRGRRAPHARSVEAGRFYFYLPSLSFFLILHNSDFGGKWKNISLRAHLYLANDPELR